MEDIIYRVDSSLEIRLTFANGQVQKMYRGKNYYPNKHNVYYFLMECYNVLKML